MPTPVRKQYLEIKERYPDALLLFRMGDFYETFDEDARIAARDLEIVLTQRDMGQGEVVPLAGIPYHALPVTLLPAEEDELAAALGGDRLHEEALAAHVRLLVLELVPERRKPGERERALCVDERLPLFLGVTHHGGWLP